MSTFGNVEAVVKPKEVCQLISTDAPSALCERAVKKKKQNRQTSIFMVVYLYGKFNPQKTLKRCEEKPAKKSEAASKQTADDLSETDIFVVEESEEGTQKRKKEKKDIFIKVAPCF